MGLVGRRTQLSSVAAALDDAATGAGCVVGVAGEPGIGKTRLARSVIELAAARGFTVLSGHTPVREMGVAYAPLLEALGGHLRSLDNVGRAALTSGLSELGLLLGSLVVGRPEPLADPALEQARLFEAVARLVDRLQQQSPMLLFVDDVHEADAASIALLGSVCRRLSGQRVLALLTYRSDADSRRSLHDLRVALRRQALLQEVTLEPLPRQALAELAAAQLGGRPSEALLDMLEARAGGVPLFAHTLLAGLRDAGQLEAAGGRWTPSPGAETHLPSLARDVILGPLSASAQ